METVDTLATMRPCAMCGANFPGEGIEIEGKHYCCDRCADFGQHKSHMVAKMAPKVAGLLAVGACIGYAVARQRYRLHW